MMELFFLLIFISSFLGIVAIFVRKIPLILSFEPPKEDVISKLKEKVKNLVEISNNFSFEIFLQKLIRRIRILSLKIDNLTLKWLKKLRKKYSEGKKDNYWDNIKKEIK